MRTTTKLLSVILSICMVISIAVVGVVPAAAASTDDTLAQDTVQGSAVLHCFNWSYNNIKAALPDIAAAGYTAVQTSPVQRPKDYNSSWIDAENQWWKMYQPLGFSIAADGTSWLGTKAQLTSLCAEAENYGIKVIVDIVANHLGNNGTDGGTFSYINSAVESDLKNANYYHSNNIRTNDDSRYNITQYHLGMPDLNTANSYVQQRALGLLEECIDCGVDGFRFDAAKHIETPTDASNIKSNFWPTVIDGAKSYAETKGVDEPFFYGEILGNAGPNFGISNYTTYMAITDNYTGDRVLDKTYWKWAPDLADSTYYKGASADKSVLWVESHDTYMGSSGSAWTGNTSSVSSEDINRAWAFVASRADSTALFFARPNSTMGAASTDTNWKSTVVTEANKFKNHFNGTTEYISSSGDKIAYNERGDSGVVIVKLDGQGSVDIDAHTMASGTYTDQITGSTFTVANGKISGSVGSTGVAVVYNKSQSATEYIETSPLYLKPNSNWTIDGARFAMYVTNSSTGDDAWVSMTDEDGDGYYSAELPAGDWTNVTFKRMNTNPANNSSNVWNETNALFPDDGTNCYTIASGAWSKGDGTWSAYSSQGTTAAPTTVAPTTVAPTTVQPTTAPPSNTYTIYAISNAEWSNVYVYWWGSSTACSWPGNEMTSYSGTKVYTYNIPNDATGLIFNIGSNSKQTVDITSGINDGAVFTINSTQSNGKYTYSAAPDYYLVGTMNNWSNNNNYKFSISANSDGKLEYKLSGVQLAANAELKVHSSTETWYPSGNNYTVPSAGTYDIYFRPGGDGGSGWYNSYFKVVKPCTVTWKDGDGNTLKTEIVESGTTPSYTGATPAKTATAQYSYTFTGWSPAPAAVTDDTTYTAQFDSTVNKYTVTWKNYDGTVLETDTNVEYGSYPSYDGNTPTRPKSDSTIYTFSGWSPELTNETTVTSDVTYTADYSTATQTYTITWKDGDGNTLETETYVEGTTPQYTGATPTKTATAQYTYTFNNTWSPAVSAATADATYTAQFDSTVNKYTVTWKNHDGTVLETDTNVAYGTTPTYNGNTPARAATAQYTYTFSGWSPTVSEVTGNTEYTAQFTSDAVGTYDITVTNAIGWDNVYVYYWIGGANNSWPGTPMTPNEDGFIYTASVPATVSGIIFTNGAQSNTAQTADITAGIEDGAHWAVSLYNNNITVNKVPTYYLVGSMTSWSTAGAAEFVPVKNSDGLEEYKATGVQLHANDQLKVSDGVLWFPDGYDNQYDITADGTYDIYFRPHGDGNNDWHETYFYFYVANVTPYTITWKDGDGNTLKTDTVTHGETPSYTGETPAKTPTAQYTYTFNNTWSPTVTAATANATYTAQFDSTVNKYQITWMCDGTVLDTEEVAYGETPVYTGQTPARPSTAQYSYTFTGWSPEIESVSGPVTYNAQFSESVNTFTVTWKNYDGTVLETDTDVAYGTTPTYNGETPTKQANGQYHYVFSGWMPGITSVTTNTDYTAVFSEHSLYHRESIPATCTEAGNIEYWYCATCHSYFNNEDCADEHMISYDDTVIPAKGHTPMWSHAANAATCTEPGNNAYYECGTCHRYFSDINGENEIAENSWIIPASGHSWDFANGRWYWYGIDSYDVNAPYEYNMVTAEMEVDCVHADQTTQLQANVILETYHAPTCDSDGMAQFRAVLLDYPQYEVLSEEIVIPALSHNYGQPQWSWAADHSTATATFTCGNCLDAQTLDANVVTSYSNGNVTYTAMVTFNNTPYSDVVTTQRDSLIGGHSLTLRGDVGVNFFLNPTPEELAQGITVSFEWFDKSTEPVSVVYDERTGLYKATCYVAAAEMTYNITAKIKIGETVETTDIYAPKTYAEYILTSERFIADYTESYGADGYNKLKELVQAMLDYGTRAQIRFDRNQENYANDGTFTYDNTELSWESGADDMTTDLENYGLTYVGSTVIYLSKTALRHYYKITEPDLFAQFAGSVKMDGNAIEYGERNGMIYFEVPEIVADELDVQHVLTIGETSYSYSATDYLARLVDTTDSETARDLAKATYRYHLKAKAYFG